MIKKELMPFKKYVQSRLNMLYCEETIPINGTFKEIPSGNIVKGDIFIAHKLGRCNIQEIYKTYIDWFNHTRNDDEPERVFVSVKEHKET